MLLVEALRGHGQAAGRFALGIEAMMLTPAGVLGVWLRGILSIMVVVGAISLFVQWYDELPRWDVRERNSSAVRVALSPWQRMASWRPGLDEETALLAGGVFLTLLAVGGGGIGPRLLLARGRPMPELNQGTSQRIIRPDGTELHIESHGPPDALPVILTHGWGMNRSEWGCLQQASGDQFRLIVWDLPGLGQSIQPNNRDFRMEKLADDLKAVIETTGDRPVILVGHSIGGMIILEFCTRFPGLLERKVAGAVIVHSTHVNPLHTTQFSGLMLALQKPLIEPLLHLQIWLSPLVWLMNWMSYLNGSTHWSVKRSGFAGHATGNKVDYVARQETIANPAVVARGALGMLGYDVRNKLSSISIPVLSVPADLDTVTLPQACEEIRRAVPQGRLSTLSQARHFGLLEHDESFAAVTFGFCGEAIRSRGSLTATPSPGRAAGS